MKKERANSPLSKVKFPRQFPLYPKSLSEELDT
jgi:hypothetical protein